MKCPLATTLVFFCTMCNSVTTADRGVSMPVFLIDDGQVLSHIHSSQNPFSKTTNTIFSDIIYNVLKYTATIVIFVEDKFSTEDVSAKDRLGSPYYHLRQGMLENKVKYFPSVQSPYNTFTTILKPKSTNMFRMNSRSTQIKIFDSNFKHYFIFFEDWPNVTRVNALREHDLIMKEVYFIVKQLSTGPIAAFYTGKTNPILLGREFDGKNKSATYRTEESSEKVQEKYVTVGIASCLFIVAICLLMFLYGVCTFFDCLTNDRYEDPHGKALALTDS